MIRVKTCFCVSPELLAGAIFQFEAVGHLARQVSTDFKKSSFYAREYTRIFEHHHQLARLLAARHTQPRSGQRKGHTTMVPRAIILRMRP